MEPIEWIKSGEQVIAVIIRRTISPNETTFITPDQFNQQVGFIVYPAGGQIPPHKHKAIERQIVGTAETLIVQRGKMEVQLYDDHRRLLTKRQLVEGDILVLVSGGHGFSMLEDTVLLEIKQGPYTGLAEKEHFDDPGK